MGICPCIHECPLLSCKALADDSLCLAAPGSTPKFTLTGLLVNRGQCSGGGERESVSLAQISMRSHDLLHKLMSFTSSQGKQAANAALCREKHLTQKAEAVLVVVAHREGARARDTIFKHWYSGHSSRLREGIPLKLF